ncbi:MAG: SCO6880 family protein, partial [Actinomycetes bacterium]
MTATQEDLTVEFGALEQRGLLLGVSGASLTTAAVGVVTGIGLLFVVGGSSGLLGALSVMVAAGVVAFLPVHGNPLAEWVLLLIRYLARAASGRASWRSGTPTAGVRSDRAHVWPVQLPEPLRQARTRVVATPYVDGDVGVILDGQLVIGVLKARASSAFLMKQPGEQAAATSEWADIIGSIADPGSPWVRLQWRDTTTPVDSGSLVSFLAEAMCPEARQQGSEQHHARVVYERLLRTAAPVSESHEILLAVAMDPRRVARQVKDAGGGDRGTAAVLVRHLEQFAYKLASGDILVEGMLSARQVGQVIREQADP